MAVITSIALDHIDWLGDNRETIGYEKAGIIRSGRPVVCTDFDPPISILNHAERLSAPLYLVNRDFGYSVHSSHWDWWNSEKQYSSNPLPHLPLPSLSAALQVVWLMGIDLIGVNAFDLLPRLSVPGRFQIKEWRGRQVILDVAHNPAATAYLAERLQQRASSTSSVHAVVAMMSDKDRVQSLSNLKESVTHWYLADLSFIARAATIDNIRQNLRDLGELELFSGSVAECLQAAHQNTMSGDRILVFGSFFTVAAAMQVLDEAVEI